MIEDEAKTKWCPFSRTLTILADGSQLYPGNRLSVATTITTTGDPLSPESCRCIASACMAWRWDNRKTGHDLDWQIGRDGPEGGRKAWEAFCRQDPLRGHCGLAGKSS